MGLNPSKVFTCSAEFYCASQQRVANSYHLLGVHLIYEGADFLIDNLEEEPKSGIEAVVDFKPLTEVEGLKSGFGTALIPKLKILPPKKK